MVPPLFVYVMQAIIHLDQLALNSIHLHVQQNHVQPINIAVWLVQLLHVTATPATLVHLALFQLHVQPWYASVIKIVL